MAEEEKIREHAKHALQDLTNKNKKWKERIKDFAWEVFIIIVAVNITLWFHSWSEKRHDRELEKDFLIGTREDLDIVKKRLETGIAFYQPTLNYYDSVWIQMNEHRIDKAFVDSNSYNLINTSYFVYDNSRFENFKSSGNLRLIENESLLRGITFLYDSQLSWLVNMDNLVYGNRQRDFITYFGSKARVDSSGQFYYVSDLLNSPEIRFHVYWYKFILNERKDQKQYTIQQIDTVIIHIDNELKTRFNYEVK